MAVITKMAMPGITFPVKIQSSKFIFVVNVDENYMYMHGLQFVQYRTSTYSMLSRLHYFLIKSVVGSHISALNDANVIQILTLYSDAARELK